MADLFDRLFVTEGDDKIAVHTFHAALVEYADGQATTKAQIITALALDAEAEADLTALCNAVDAASGVANKLLFVTRFHAAALLAEKKLKYHTKAAFRARMGLA